MKPAIFDFKPLYWKRGILSPGIFEELIEMFPICRFCSCPKPEECPPTLRNPFAFWGVFPIHSTNQQTDPMETSIRQCFLTEFVYSLPPPCLIYLDSTYHCLTWFNYLFMICLPAQYGKTKKALIFLVTVLSIASTQNTEECRIHRSHSILFE